MATAFADTNPVVATTMIACDTIKHTAATTLVNTDEVIAATILVGDPSWTPRPPPSPH